MAATRTGIQAATRIAAVGIPVLLTVVYSAMQAVSAACAGATYLAPYVGRMADAGPRSPYRDRRHGRLVAGLAEHDAGLGRPACAVRQTWCI